MNAPFPQISNTQAFLLLCSLATVAIAALVLFGWVSDVTILKTVLPGYPEMKPVTAVSFVLMGMALGLTTFTDRNPWLRYITAFAGWAAVAVSLLMLGAYLFHFSTGADRFLVPDLDTAGSRMSPHSTLNFLLIGISFAFLNARGSAFRQLSGVAALAAMAATYAAILGHLYHADLLYGVSKLNGMAPHTAFLFFIVAAGLAWQNGNFRIVRLLRSDSLGGTAARRLLPFVILVPTAIGWLRVIGQERGLYDTGFGTAMSTFSLVSIMLAIVLFYSRTVHRADEKRRRVEADLADKEMRYREVFDYSQGMICIHETDGVLRSVNPAVLASTGYSQDDLIGKNIVEFLPPEHRVGIAAFLRQIEHEGLSSGLLPIVAKDGRQLMWRYHSILVSETGKEPYVIGHALDVTELMAAQSALRNLSLTDELTGLYNRRGFLTLAEQQLKLERHNNTARGLTLLFADMDGLKRINDTHGHEAGSDAIATLARLLDSAVRDADLVARWGGDEFVVLSIGAQGENSQLVVDRINARLDEYNASSGKPYKVACSVGIAPVDMESGRTFEEIIAEADEAMYDEKKKRKASRDDLPAFQIEEPNSPEDSWAWY